MRRSVSQIQRLLVFAVAPVAGGMVSCAMSEMSAGATNQVLNMSLDYAALHNLPVVSQITALPLDSPPINGFVPQVVFGLTTQQSTQDATFAAHVSSSPGGSTLPIGGVGTTGLPAYFVATLDTGSQSHIVHYDEAQVFNIDGANRGGAYTADIAGASGTETADISDGLGVYASGFQNVTSNGSALAPAAGTLRGQFNTAILTTEQNSVLPNIIGSPMVAQYQTVIKNSETRRLTVGGQTFKSPRVEFQTLNTPPPQQYYDLPLDVLSVNGISPDPVFIPSLDNFNNYADNPTTPTFWASLFANADLTNKGSTTADRQFLFDTGAQVTVLSRLTAAQVGFYTGGPNPSTPDFFVEVSGVGGSQQVPGFYMDQLKITTDGGPLVWTHVPVIVLDVIDPRDGVGAVPGVIGMNLFTDRDLIINGGTTDPFVAISSAITPAWNSALGGSWGEDLKWTLGVPETADAAANFLSAITSPQSITVDIDYTIGSMKFDNANRYTINGPGRLTMQTTTGADASINVVTGSHTINAPMTFANAATIIVTPAAGTLTISNDVNAASVTITKAGAGTLEMKNIRSAGLNIGAGTVAVLSNGGNTGASKVNSLTIAGSTNNWTATLDLKNNDLVVQSSASGRAAALANIYNQLKTAVNGAGGLWTGKGLTSSTAAAETNLTFALGVLLNDDGQFGGSGAQLYATFSGQSADKNAILVKFTYFGDADLTGVVDITDYFLIDSGFNSHLINGGWVNGDFDYSGAVDSTDYFLIDYNFNAHRPGLAPESAEANFGHAVPEPGGLLTLGATGVLGAISPRRKRGPVQAMRS